MSGETTAIVFLGVSNLAPWALIAAGKLRTPAQQRRPSRTTSQPTPDPVADHLMLTRPMPVSLDAHRSNGHVTEADRLAAQAYAALEAADGNATHAAEAMGLARTTFRGRVNRHLLNLGRAS